MQQGAKYRRKQYFVAKKFQLKYVGTILALVFLTAIMCSYLVYYTMMVIMGDKIANVYPQGRLMSIVNTVNIRILVSMLLLTPIITIIGIFASHKIAGPIDRIERFLGSMAGGDFSQVLTLRKKDELISLVNGINGVVNSVKSTVKRANAHIDDLSTSMDNVKKLAQSKPVNHEALDKALNKLHEDVSVLKSEVKKYKV